MEYFHRYVVVTHWKLVPYHKPNSNFLITYWMDLFEARKYASIEVIHRECFVCSKQHHPIWLGTFVCKAVFAREAVFAYEASGPSFLPLGKKKSPYGSILASPGYSTGNVHLLLPSM